MKKPKWVVQKEQDKKAEGNMTLWLFGLHAVRDALMNPNREKLTLMVTPNAQAKLEDAIAFAGIAPQVEDPRKFRPPLDPGSVHQGAVLEVKPLNWGRLEDVCIGDTAPRVLLLDRVTDPHNVGAILRSAEVLGASAVIGTRHHSAPETGAPWPRPHPARWSANPICGCAIWPMQSAELQDMGYLVLGLDGEAAMSIEAAVEGKRDRPVALVLGAEGPGLREKTKETVDMLVRIDAAGGFGSLNVSNAAAIALYASRDHT